MPPALAAAKAGTPYAGGRRYECRTTGTREPVSKAEYAHTVELAEGTLRWAREQVATESVGSRSRKAEEPSGRADFG